jgi:ADP-ribosylglycohydrolase
MTASPIASMLFGALVADAASLGVHWLYDPERIAEIAGQQGGRSAFTPVDAKNFEGARGYFAHGARQNGMLTQYGEVLRLAIRSINAEGGFDVGAYQTAFTAHFGPGGSYQGYIDRPTRGALANILAEVSPSGIDDDQHPAIATLPAVFARYRDTPDLTPMINAAMQVTNVNSIATAYSTVFADLLARVTTGEGLHSALEAAAAAADPLIRAELSEGLTTTEPSSVDYGEHAGRACHLPMSGRLMFHILKHSADFTEAVERNTLTGGDSAGRAILIGAVMGAVHGVATEKGIPLSWILKLDDAAAIWTECQTLA